MASIEQLNSALIKADAAGDVEAAKAFASEIRRLRAEVKPEETVSEARQNVEPEKTLPEWGKNNPRLYKAAQVAREYGGPALEMGLPIVTGIIGAGGGTIVPGAGNVAGGVGGAALGYGIAKEATRLADLYLGNVQGEKPQETVMRGLGNIAEGGLYEVGGRVAAPYLVKAAQLGNKGLGKVIDAATGELRTVNAANIARNAIGTNLPEIKNALTLARPDETAAQATANVNSPIWQALNQRIQKTAPDYYTGVANAQNTDRLNRLAYLAGGGDQTAARTLREESKNALNAGLIPQLTIELNAANTAGKQLPKLQGEANRFGEAATNKVQDVRNMVAAGDRATANANATFPVAGMPRVPARYTYMGELATKADEVANKAANASLPFGEASRFAQAAADSLAAHGLKPLKTDSIVSSLNKVAKNPEFAGNRELTTAINRVGKDMAEWTNAGGVIDAWALDSIRKNSVNSAIRELYPNADASTQKELAAKVLGKIKPVIVDAIESAGGTGYGQYLNDYTKGMQAINQKKLGAEALKLYETAPNEFVKLVEGNNPKAVEKIFGAGNYDIVKQMSDDAMFTLKDVGREVTRDVNVANQAIAGREAANSKSKSLSEYIPGFVGFETAALKKGIQTLEGRISGGTMEALVEGLKTGKSAAQLLEQVPANEKIKVLNAIAKMNPRGAIPALGAKTYLFNRNSLVPEQQDNQNALAR
jgi:hypothetical protein